MKTIIIVGAMDTGKTAALSLLEKGIDIEIVTQEQASERGLTISTNTDPPKPFVLTNPYPNNLFTLPKTRAEKRKANRSKQKNRKK